MKVIKKKNEPLKKRAFTVQEVAGQCGVHEASVYRAIYRGDLKPMAGFGRNMIADVELERFLNTQRDPSIQTFGETNK